MTYQHRHESDAERASRIEREAVELARARRHAESGEVLSGPELEAWLDSLDKDTVLPLPKLPIPG
jgi:hypothetical protein